MRLSLQTAPTKEPVTRDEVKKQLRIDHNDEDQWLSVAITTARRIVEDARNQAFITQTWDLTLDRFPRDAIILPKAPLQSVTSVKYNDVDGVEQTWSSSDYTVDASSDAMPGRIVPDEDEVWPSTEGHINDVTVRFVAGFGDDRSDVPDFIRHLIMATVETLYWNRGTITEANIRETAFYRHLVWAERPVRFH